MKNLRILLYIAALGAALSAAAQTDGGKNTRRERSRELFQKLATAEMATANLYVDSVDEGKLVEDAIRGMISELDPHSGYLTPEEAKSLNEPLQGNFDGVGVQFNMLEDTLLVIQTINGGPAEKAGVAAGDRFVTVNDTAIAGVKMPKEDIMRRLRGPRGTKVKIGVRRHGIGETLHFTVKRDKIPVNTLEAAYMIRPGIGYIRLSSFGATTHEEFREALKTLKAEGMGSLILDLRDNGGGYLQAAVNVADELLAEGDLIVYTEGRKVKRREYRACGGGMFREGGLTVLVNEFSASAAEIVSGAVQDQDRGAVVGRRTFGKGLVQRPIELPDGSMLRLTIAHYYTPSGRCIQKPYAKGRKDEYSADIMNRYERGEFVSADSIHFADSLRYETVKKRRSVYGGGGVMPDEFVPLDTTLYTKYHRQLAAKTIIINKVLHYNDQNRKLLLRKYGKTAKEGFGKFFAEYQVPQALIGEIFAEGERRGVKPADDNERKRTVRCLSVQLKGIVARDLWTMTEYFRVMNEESAVVKRALEKLAQKDTPCAEKDAFCPYRLPSLRKVSTFAAANRSVSGHANKEY